MASLMSSDFRTIKSWEDAKPFAGRFVAYQTNSYYFGSVFPGDRYFGGSSFGGAKRYTLGCTLFGYIVETPRFWTSSMDGDETGYEMIQVMMPEKSSGNCALTTAGLAREHFSMRLATKEEIELIYSGINAKQAKFNVCFDFEQKKMYEILKRHLPERSQKGWGGLFCCY